MNYSVKEEQTFVAPTTSEMSQFWNRVHFVFLINQLPCDFTYFCFFLIPLLCLLLHLFALIINSLSSHSSQERPKSALERLYSGEPAQQQRGKMSADEQLERMKRHQKALVRQRKRTLSHGDRHASSTSRASSSSSRPLSADMGSVCY